VGLEWTEEHWGGSWRGEDAGLLVGQVVPYDAWHIEDPDGVGRVVHDGCRWAAFIRRDPVPGRWATAEEAMHAADQAHETAPGD
jgi:hypothetical protein